MTLEHWILGLQAAFLLYFIALNTSYIALNVLSFARLKRYLGSRALDELGRVYSGFEPPVSVLVPAYNEEASIAASVRSMLQLEYPEFEVIVINDGSRDGTMEVLERTFRLVHFPEAYWKRIPVKNVRGVYRSRTFPNLRVIDKENGGKADAMNAGINASRHPLFCVVDADSVLERSSLARVVEPFLESPLTIASGGTVRIANGCTVREGFLVRVGLPRRLLPLLQVVEYMRAFLFGRFAWTPLNAVLIISGAFGVFRRDAVVEVGGFRSDTVGEDMELVVRLHRHYRLRRRPYRIAFVPDPICWTEAPERLATLKSQRMRWQRGLAESISMNRRLLFHPRGGAPGWLSLPFMFFFELIGPILEVVGYVFIATAFALGLVSWQATAAFLLVAIGFGIALSVSALLLEELSFQIYPRPGQAATLAAAAVIENFGYRQLISLWRLWSLVRWATGREQAWGNMRAAAAPQQPRTKTHV